MHARRNKIGRSLIGPPMKMRIDCLSAKDSVNERSFAKPNESRLREIGALDATVG